MVRPFQLHHPRPFDSIWLAFQPQFEAGDFVETVFEDAFYPGGLQLFEEVGPDALIAGGVFIR